MLYKRIQPKKLTGAELFVSTGSKRFTVLDFWQYAFSVLNDNILRGRLAEFLVEAALKDLPDIGVRTSWGDFDVEDFDGTKIEVKCSAYIQDYDQNDFSNIRFSGLKAKEVYYSDAVKPYKDLAALAYKADIYVLVLQHHKEHLSFDILDMNQWSFYILTRDCIARVANNGMSVGMGRLIEHEVTPVAFENIQAIVQGLKVDIQNK
jgi:hypothetical protein